MSLEAYLGSLDMDCTEDGDGIWWICEDIDGWWGAPPTALGHSPGFPDGSVLLLSRNIGREIVVSGTAYDPDGGLTWAQHHQAVQTLNGAADAVIADKVLKVDESATVTLRAAVRRNGRVRTRRLGSLDGGTLHVSFEIPLFAPDWRRYQDVASSPSIALIGGDLTEPGTITNNGDADTYPVVTIDGRTIGRGRPGPVTKQLQAAFRQLTKTQGVRY